MSEEPSRLLNVIAPDADFGPETNAAVERAVQAAVAAYAAHNDSDHPGVGCDEFRVFLLAKVAEATLASQYVTRDAGLTANSWLLYKVRPLLPPVYKHGSAGVALLNDILTAAGVPPVLVRQLCSFLSVAAVAAPFQPGYAATSESEARAACVAVVEAYGLKPPPAGAPTPAPQTAPAAPPPSPEPPPLFVRGKGGVH